jgi:ABC-type multidrug transport system fused ATPase/permease subunit
MRTIMTMIGVSYAWYGLDPTLYVHGIVAGLCHLSLFHLVQPAYQRNSDESTKRRQEIEANMNEYVQKHQTILLYGWQTVYEESHTRIMNLYRQAMNQESYSYGFLLLASQTLPGWGETYLILYMLQQGQPVPAVMEVVAYYQLMNSAIQACKDQWIETWKKRRSMKMLWDLIQRPVQPNIPITHRLTNPSIEWDQITFRYPTSSVPVLTDFSLSIQAGECVVLSAKSGRGKTTLLSLLMGMYPVEKGQIRIGSHDVATLHPSQIREWISIVPQDSWYDPNRTVRENIMMGLQTPFPEDLLDRVELSEFQSRKEERIANLSGGQKQRLALARVLVRDTPIIILDEPTSALDSFNEEEVSIALHNLFK